MKSYDIHTYYCALNKVFGYEPVLAQVLMEQIGSAEAVFSASRDEISRALGRSQGAQEQLGAALLEWAETELKKVADAGGRFLCPEDEDYPGLLVEIPDPPLGLYFKSASTPTEVCGLRHAVAVVGTRDLSPYGREWCIRLVQALSLSERQPLIVSGLAYGADAAAHRTALAEGLPTVGVMATGLDDIYPWRNRPLSEEMLSTPGCALVTDYPMGTSPVALNFIRRNRIIAALADATLVIESKTKGGSLITAKYANDYDRDVYALPGRVDDPRSQGCNSLIQKKMAEIITGEIDLAERLGLGAGGGERQDFDGWMDRRYGPDSLAARIAKRVHAQRGIDYEQLSQALDVPYAHILETVALLEADNVLTTDLLQRCYLSHAALR